MGSSWEVLWCEGVHHMLKMLNDVFRDAKLDDHAVDSCYMNDEAYKFYDSMEETSGHIHTKDGYG